ncbi:MULTISPECIES: type II toxin-antitoxin system VapC family toxin [Serinicoccus]|uniref:type II toxin-antitoxin system VapC family toxin n=1 Tax=Serinicoccus TaxID=265976 RepID=UPI0009FB4C72|nr:MULTISPECIES: type II toxin-antitoxin system VapC family toxin [Serinicoccus]
MTIVLDTSAVAAVIFGEPDAETLLRVMQRAAGDLLMSAATSVEVGIVVETRQGREATQDLRLLLDRLGVDIAPLDAAQASIAVDAWRRFGKGRHPASLNLGDCFAYAAAQSRDAPLLFKGGDFAQTDVRSAL